MLPSSNVRFFGNWYYLGQTIETNLALGTADESKKWIGQHMHTPLKSLR